MGSDYTPFVDCSHEEAADYRESRPRYPAALADHLAAMCVSRDLALDSATGNGQAAGLLAPHFKRIVATDASPAQIANASRHRNVNYIIAHAEAAPLRDSSVDLVTVAVAIHWFELDRFYREVQRVVRPGGVLACWAYHLPTVSPEVDEVVGRFYAQTLRDYWSSRVRYVEEGYRSLPFPYERIETPPFQLLQKWTLGRFSKYISTWSGAAEYRARLGKESLEEIREDLASAWGEPNLDREVTWDLHMRVGRVN